MRFWRANISADWSFVSLNALSTLRASSPELWPELDALDSARDAIGSPRSMSDMLHICFIRT